MKSKILNLTCFLFLVISFKVSSSSALPISQITKRGGNNNGNGNIGDNYGSYNSAESNVGNGNNNPGWNGLNGQFNGIGNIGENNGLNNGLNNGISSYIPATTYVTPDTQKYIYKGSFQNFNTWQDYLNGDDYTKLQKIDPEVATKLKNLFDVLKSFGYFQTYGYPWSNYYTNYYTNYLKGWNPTSWNPTSWNPTSW